MIRPGVKTILITVTESIGQQNKVTMECEGWQAPTDPLLYLDQILALRVAQDQLIKYLMMAEVRKIGQVATPITSLEKPH